MSINKRFRRKRSVGTGRMVYVPKCILDKMVHIKRVRKIDRRIALWDEVNRLTDIGLNVDDFYSAFFGKR